MKRIKHASGILAVIATVTAALVFTFAPQNEQNTEARPACLPDVVVTAERPAHINALIADGGDLPDVLVIANTGTAYTLSRSNDGSSLPDVIVTAENADDESVILVSTHTSVDTEETTTVISKRL